ncbi:hypothetical protein Hanom_Chr03g00240021 [Helianthus anomalus]
MNLGYSLCLSSTTRSQERSQMESLLRRKAPLLLSSQSLIYIKYINIPSNI